MDATDPIEQTPQMQAARQAVAEAAKVTAMPRPAYRQAAHQLPMLLQRHGLGQTLAYLQMRGDGRPTSPFNVLLRQLDRWLLASLAVSGRSAVSVLSGRDSRFYREACEQTWVFVRALHAVLEETP